MLGANSYRTVGNRQLKVVYRQAQANATRMVIAVQQAIAIRNAAQAIAKLKE